MHHALIWLLTIEVLGLVAFPLTFSLFRRLPDRGFALSKVLALLLASYVLWVVGLTHLLPNAQYTVVLIVALMALVSLLVLRLREREIWCFIRSEWPSLLAGQLVFLGLFFLWVSLVSFSPAINHTEKPMDFAFLNSILRSTHFPPEDPWLLGHSISYYYFGHFMMATLTKLTAIPSAVSYNLATALLPALLGAGAFSLVYNLIRLSGARMRNAILFGLAAPLFLLLLGNLEGVLELVHARGWGSEGFWQWVSIKGLEGGNGSSLGIFPSDYLWWWRGTRVIDSIVEGASLDYTITEFPFFSYLLGDLHAHASALPFLVLNLALGLNLFVSAERLGLSWLRNNLWQVFGLALSLGALAFINIWDFPVFAALFFVTVLVKSYGDWSGQAQHAVLSALVLAVPVLAGAVLLYLPFYLDLGSQVSGIAAVGDISTRPLFFFLIWGLFLLLSGSFLMRQLLDVAAWKERAPGPLTVVLVVTLLPFLLWAGWELLALWTGWGGLIRRLDGGVVGSELAVGARFGKLLPGLAIVGLASYIGLSKVRHGGDRATVYPLLVLALAMYLLVGAELFYVVDLFGNRMNTVFKLYYQAWLLLAIVSAYGLHYWLSRPMPSLWRLGTGHGKGFGLPRGLSSRSLGRSVRYAWMALVGVLILASVYYPVGAALDRTKGSGGNTLDGLAYLKKGGNASEYEAIRWLWEVAPRGRLVEAAGDGYTEYGRISASTGLPTMLGWKGHERQWRGLGSSKLLDEREAQVESIYSSDDPEYLREILEAFDIRYVYVGARERAKYGGGHFDKFPSLVQPVFQAEGVVIYERLRPGEQGIINSDVGDAS